MDSIGKYKNLSYILLFFTLVFFSSIEVVTKNLSLNFYLITIIRFFIGLIVLFPFALKNLKNFNKKDLLFIFINGNILIFSMLFLQVSVYYGDPSFSAILVSTNVIFVKIFTLIIEKKEDKLIFVKILFLLVGIIGIYLFLKEDIKNFNYLNLIFGILSSVLFGLFTTLNKKFLNKYNQFSLNFILFLSGLIILIIFSLLNKKLDFNYFKNIKLEEVIILIYSGVFVTGIAYIFFFYGLKYNSAVDASFIFYFKPFLAYTIYCLFFGLYIKVNKFIYIIIVVFSILLYSKAELMIRFISKILIKNNVNK